MSSTCIRTVEIVDCLDPCTGWLGIRVIEQAASPEPAASGPFFCPDESNCAG